MLVRRTLFALTTCAALIVPNAHAAAPTRLQVHGQYVDVWAATQTELAGFRTGGPLVNATLTSAGAPVAGRVLTFTRQDGRVICRAVTTLNGAAGCDDAAVADAMPFDRFTASFAGDARFEPARTQGNVGRGSVYFSGHKVCWANDSSTGLVGCNL